MKRVILALAMLVCLPWTVWAQSLYQEDDVLTVDGPNVPTTCSSKFHKGNQSAQAGKSGVWLEYIVETTIDLNVCLYGVRATRILQLRAEPVLEPATIQHGRLGGLGGEDALDSLGMLLALSEAGDERLQRAALADGLRQPLAFLPGLP